MKSDNIRLRLLRVLELLKAKSDKEHPLSASEILDELKKYGIEAERKAVYRDIEALKLCGCDIVRTASVKKGYYLASREFALPEIRLLTDAVLSAGFIPKKSTEQLVNKLQGLVSVYQADEIRGSVCIENRSKSENRSVYDTIEQLNTAIINKRKIRVKYAKSRLCGTALTTVTKDMLISPYALMWEADHYYLIGNNAKYDNLMHLRVDRIAQVAETNEPWRHFSEVSEYSQRFDTADYARKTFNMFGGEKCRIDLECKVELLDQITDKFTEGIFIRHAEGEQSFRFSTEALISDGLVGWLMQFGGDIRVLSPETLKKEVLEKAKKLTDAYSR